ncbi:hypothetical protein Q4575_12820 [Psychrosphaera sp. 1_MG-2023]|uniref:hypothetical protein n=1 Tax=Psychrosphaera sp. 1_MG-2023 TaxID=3062643 RepID=UPI0026E1B9EF|nr:hypothetical protein [Psychrosphaera sp. 1_MG-2023]MDO6720293.1 hypothetical protein [Psychrosphaera sp. 1_MG-2023]
MSVILVASIILILIAFVHSYLGEKYILMRLFKRDNIPHLFGSDQFTKGTLRFCWHIMSVAALGFAAILHNASTSDVFTLKVIGVVFLLSALLAIWFTKGKHLSWIAFLIVSTICFIKAYLA